ncbi:MAG: hypothetical protein AMXMBFR23_22250 [Chloroflexota bacterium]
MAMNGSGFTPIAVVSVRTPEREQRLAPPGLWIPAAAMAVSLLIAALGGLTLGILAAFEVSVAGDRWLVAVQAHGELQLWGWFAVFIVTLLFEFIVRLNGRAPVPLRTRVLVLSLLGSGALISATGRLVEGVAPALVPAGASMMAVGASLLAVTVMRIRPAHPYRVDLHPLFFRAGVLWLLVAAVAALVASRQVAGGATSLEESHVVAEIVLRGFVMNVTFAVGLRAFVGHLGLPPMPVERQRVLFGLVNGGIVVWVAGTGGFGLPGSEALTAAGDLLFAAGMLWATWAFDILRAARRWRRPAHRAQLLVPVAWAGLVAYALLLAAQAVLVLGSDTRPTLFETGAARHLLALGFVAPLLLAMSHVVLERFLIGRLTGERWLTAAFALLVVAWPLRVVPPLVDGGMGEVAQGLMGTAGMLTSAALLVAAAVSAQNGLAAERYVRLLRRLDARSAPARPASGMPAVPPSTLIPMAGDPRPGTTAKGATHMHEIDVRPDIAAGREPFPRIMAAARALGPGEAFRLVAPFEPAPLYEVLGAQGFQHEAAAQPDGSWHVTFRRTAGA